MQYIGLDSKIIVIDLNLVKRKCYPLEDQYFEGYAYESWHNDLFSVDGSSADA